MRGTQRRSNLPSGGTAARHTRNCRVAALRTTTKGAIVPQAAGGRITPAQPSPDRTRPDQTWPDDALLLIAHGATRFADAGRLVHAHAAVLRARQVFADVAVGLLNGTPPAAEALSALAPRIVHVVPFFMEQGWFVREAIPQALGDGQGHELRYHQPVGVHPGLADLAAARVQRACGTGSERFAVLLAGHGSARAPGRPMALHRHAEALTASGHFAQVRAAFLEEPPLLADALRAWRTLPVAMLGFFAGDGGHVREDLPALLAAEHAARGEAGAPLLDLGVIGDDPAMPEIILDQVARDVPVPATPGGR